MNRFVFACLIVLSVFFSFVQLGKRAFMDYDEATYAIVYHESSVRNDFLTLTYFNEPWLQKPPLYFWLARVGASVLGENEFSLRLPSALLAAITMPLLFLIVLELTKNQRAAFLSAFILLTTGYFLFAGRQLRLDVPVAATVFSGKDALLVKVIRR